MECLPSVAAYHGGRWSIANAGFSAVIFVMCGLLLPLCDGCGCATDRQLLCRALTGPRLVSTKESRWTQQQAGEVVTAWLALQFSAGRRHCSNPVDRIDTADTPVIPDAVSTIDTPLITFTVSCCSSLEPLRRVRLSVSARAVPGGIAERSRPPSSCWASNKPACICRRISDVSATDSTCAAPITSATSARSDPSRWHRRRLSNLTHRSP